MGYQSEAATWRSAYLVGAMEPRNGVPKIAAASSANSDTLKAVSNDLFFDFLGVRLDAAKADGKHLVINWNVTDSNERFVLTGKVKIDGDCNKLAERMAMRDTFEPMFPVVEPRAQAKNQ